MIGETEFSKQKGFSMVELLITGFIFSVIFGVATSTFVNAIKVQKYNVAHQQLLDQASYAIEYMARGIRMAKLDELDSCGWGSQNNYTIVGNGTTIRFKNYNDECQIFQWDDVNQRLLVTVGDDPISGPFRLNAVPLSSDNYSITNMKFSIAGEKRDTDNNQPRVTIYLEMQDNRLTNNNPRITLQTTVSQRNLDE